MYTATIYCSDESKLLYNALTPEKAKTERFTIKLKHINKATKIEVTAKDATAFKAIVSSLVKLIEVGEKIQHGRK